MPIRPLRDGNGEQACFQLWRETWNDREAVMFTIEGEPASKARPRFDGRGSRSRAYTPAGTARAENAIGWLFRREAPRWGLPDKDSTFGVVALFFSRTRQRRDVDNMLKLVLDGLTGVAWADDDQVTEASVRKMYLGPDSDARTEVAVYRIGRVHRNEVSCQHCGKSFETWPSVQALGQGKFCSQECHLAWRRERRARVCAECGAAFEAAKPDMGKFCSRTCADAAKRTDVTCGHCGAVFTKQRCHVREVNYCSAECRNAAQRARRRSRPAGACESCGGPVSRKEYQYCQACRWGDAPASGKPQPPEG